MNPLEPQQKPRPNALSPAARAEAAAWVARLHSSNKTRELEAGLRRWLEAEPAHAAAFELATEAWEIAGNVPGRAVPRMADPFESAKAMRRPSGRPWAIAAAAGAVLIGAAAYQSQTKPVISTAVGEQRMLTLEDGSRIFLNTDTRLFVHHDAEQRSIRLESGEALFDVAKDPRRPFTVIVGERTVTALGTSFVVRRESARTSVTLVEGKVQVDSRDSDDTQKWPRAVPQGATPNSPPAETLSEERASPAEQLASVTLVPGQRVVFGDDGPPRVDEPPLEKVTAWRRGEVILDKTRLGLAVEEMNRYSPVKLQIDNPQATEIPISGIFRVGDSIRFAQAVAETYRLKIDQQGHRIVIR